MKKGMIKINGKMEVAKILKENNKTVIVSLPHCSDSKAFKIDKRKVSLILADKWEIKHPEGKQL